MRVLGLGLVGLEAGHQAYGVAWAFLVFEAFATFFLGFLELEVLEVQTIVHRYFDSVVAEGVLGVHHRMGLGPELEDYKQGVLEVGSEVHHIAAVVGRRDARQVLATVARVHKVSAAFGHNIEFSATG